ncbi:MAG: hypothetical protein ACRDL7_07080, partial [Gaiellaceae bacterium]
MVGPQICFDAPDGFMNQDIVVTAEEVQSLLGDMFNKLAAAREVWRRRGSNASIAIQNKGLRSGGDKSHDNQPVQSQEEPTVPAEASEMRPSIPELNSSKKNNDKSGTTSLFDATCDYIITGTELANQLICLSTHSMHIVARPTIISDTRYKRNSLLFSVGFVVRRKNDPRPYRPLVMKLANTLKAMEVESQFLSNDTTRDKLQDMLETIVFSLNSPRAEVNILLNDTNYLSLKLFRPPKPLAPQVPDFAVPLLLRPKWQLQMFDWDFTVNWIVPHIDGLKYTKLIAQTSGVDLEMVRACLRVLSHHGIEKFVDIFSYYKRYESTPLASA